MFEDLKGAHPLMRVEYPVAAILNEAIQATLDLCPEHELVRFIRYPAVAGFDKAGFFKLKQTEIHDGQYGTTLEKEKENLLETEEYAR